MKTLLERKIDLLDKLDYHYSALLKERKIRNFALRSDENIKFHIENIAILENRLIDLLKK
jgi:hypothetical protein